MIRVGASMAVSRWAAILGCAWAMLLVATLVLERWTGTTIQTCLFKRATGYPCPTCGSTRAASSLMRGDLFGAIAWNPLIVLVAFVGVVAMIRMGVRSLRPRETRRRPSWSQAQISCLAIGIAAAACANWAYVIWRGN